MNKRIHGIKTYVLFAICIFFLLITITPIYAQGVPSHLSYTGKLTDTGGNPLGGGGTTYYFKFSLYDSATPGSGNKVWPSSSPTAIPLTVSQGSFSVLIGDTTNGYPDTLDYDFNTNNPVYLQIEVSTDNNTFETLAPRSQLSSTAFSQIASRVSGTGDSSFGTLAGFANTLVSMLSTSVNKAVLTLKGAVGQVANLFNIKDSNDTTLFTVTASGNVGVGTNSPSGKLSVVGTGGTNFIVDNSTSGTAGICLDGNGGQCSGLDYTQLLVDTSGHFTINNQKSTGIIKLQTNNTERLRVDASGNVGIGTTTPDSKLDVWGNLQVGTSSTPTLFVNSASSKVGIGTLTPRAPLEIYGDSLANVGSFLFDQPTAPNGTTNKGPHFFMKSAGIDRGWVGFFDSTNHGSGTQLNIKSAGNVGIAGGSVGAANQITLIGSTGNVGIGTSTPTSKLSIGSGQIEVPAGTLSAPSYSFSGDLDTGLFLNSANQLGITTGGSTRLFVGSTLTATVATEIIGGGVSSLGLRFSNDQNTGIFGTGSDVLAMVTGGTERMRIDASGNVGIGTSSPSDKLHLSVGNLEGLRVESSNSGFIEVGKTNGYRWRWQNDYTSSDRLELLKGATGSVPGVSVMTILGSNGNIGIGGAPSYKLDVQDATASVIRNMSGTRSIAISSYSGDSNYIDANNAPLMLRTLSAHNIRFWTSNASRGVINSTGQFGFGNEAPTSGVRAEITGFNDGASGTKALITTLASTLATANLVNYNQQIYTSWTPGANTSSNLIRGTVNQTLKRGSFNGTHTILANLQSNYATAAAQGSGNIQGVAGFVSLTGADSGFSGTITNSVNFWAQTPLTSGGTITNQYGLYIDRQKTASVVANGWGIYQADSNDNNYFAGNIGIGTSSPSQKLSVVGNAQFTAVTSGAYGFDLNLTADGTLTTSASDERLKKNITRLNTINTLERVLQLEASEFDWISNNSHDIGLIAQHVETIFPELVFTNPTDGYKGVNYSRLPILLLSAIQEIMHIIEGFKDEFKTNTLCIGETCITESELKILLEKQNLSPVSSSEDNTSDNTEQATTTPSVEVPDTNSDTPQEQNESVSSQNPEEIVPVVDNPSLSESSTETVEESNSTEESVSAEPAI